MAGTRLRLAVLVVAVVSALLRPPSSAAAATATLDISQYAHTSWTVADGFTRGAIHSVAQPPDGYLWLGTEFGLLRFDGVRTTPAPSEIVLPSDQVNTLLTGRDGTLWIGTSQGLASWNGATVKVYPELAGYVINRTLEDREGAVWVFGTMPPSGKLCRFGTNGVRCWGPGERFGSRVTMLYEDGSGNLWFGEPHGIWRWNPGDPTWHPVDSDKVVQALSEDADGVPLVLLSGGIYRMVGSALREVSRLPDALGQLTTGFRTLRDRDGGVWIGALGGGLAHFHNGTVDLFSQSDGLSSDTVAGLLQDREGNIWVATHGGLDRFRKLPVTSFTTRQGFSSLRVFAVLASSDGSVWVRTVDGLHQLRNGEVVAHREVPDLTDKTMPRSPAAAGDVEAFGSSGGSLFEDERGRLWLSTRRSAGYLEKGRFMQVPGVPGGRVHGIAGDRSGNIWFLHETQGLVHVADTNGKPVVQRISWARLGRADFADALAVDPAQGGVWLGYYRGGVDFVKDGQVRESYGVEDGLAPGRINDLRFGRDGALWAAAEGGLTRLKDGRATTLSARDGLPCDNAHWTMEDDEGSFWLSMPCGLIRIAPSSLAAWDSSTGPQREARSILQMKVFSNADGVRSRAKSGPFGPKVTKAPDGRLWFFPLEGLSVMDPRQISLPRPPPPVHIERISADNQLYSPGREVQLPPLIRDLRIEYTALTFIAPEKVMFRVKLEGRDLEWQDVGNRRQAFYTSLGPGRYRFRVMASEDNATWNEAAVPLGFSIAPAYYQTIWFRALIVLSAVVALWAAYRYRLRQVAYEFDARLQERVHERTRIARELHDTLLQSFQGLLFLLQAASYLLPHRPDEAKEMFERAITRAEQALTEGRDAVQHLRSTPDMTDLPVAIERLAEELAEADIDGGREKPVVTVSTAGTPRPLHPVVWDDIYRIAAEALRNAFRHAQAPHIEVDIHYEAKQLCLRVRDDGAGIDLEHGAAQQSGHFGISGMRERADLIGARLALWSQVRVGTEVRLDVPADVAYSTSGTRNRLLAFRE